MKSGEVAGVSVLGRDVTEQHEKELRFTQLFETLQEGAYFSTPDGKLLDANPALVSILGYASKAELLALEPAQLNLDPQQPAILGRAPMIAAECVPERSCSARGTEALPYFSNPLVPCGMTRAS